MKYFEIERANSDSLEATFFHAIRVAAVALVNFFLSLIKNIV